MLAELGAVGPDMVGQVGQNPDRGVSDRQCGARPMGASLVIGVDSDETLLAMAKRIGADVVLDFRRQDVVVEVRRLTGGGAVVRLVCAGEGGSGVCASGAGR